MNEKIWVCIVNGVIFPNREEAHKEYVLWRKNINEPLDEEIFNDLYEEITFERYNYIYAK